MNLAMERGQKIALVGANGIGKTTFLKTICGLIPPVSGTYKYTDRLKIGYYEQENVWDDASLSPFQEIKNCFPRLNDKEVRAALARCGLKNSLMTQKLSTLSGGEQSKVKICKLSLDKFSLLVLDEPLNGLDADGMRIMREVFTDIIRDGKRSILVSSHLLGELQKVATHYGIIRHGKMICEMTADELDADCRTYIALQAGDMNKAKTLLECKYARVEEDEGGYIRVYDRVAPEDVVTCLYENGITVTEILTDKIGLEEYYMDLMKGGK